MPIKPTQMVGMLIPDGSNEFFVALAQNFQRALTEEGCAVVVMSSDGSTQREAAHLDLAFEMDVQGIIYIAVGDNLPLQARLHEWRRPILVLDREVSMLSEADFVLVDNCAGVHEGVAYLAGLGHERIAHVEGSQRTEPGRERRNCFVSACHERGLDEMSLPGDFSFLAGRDGARTILAMPSSDRPTAVFAANDLSAIGAMQHFQEAGLAIPRDISILGFDDIAIASWTYPALSTVRQDGEKIAKAGAALLIQRMRHLELNPGTDLGPRFDNVEPRLEIRASCAPPPAV